MTEPVPWAWMLARPREPDRVEEDLSWMDRGACLRHDPNWWSQDLALTQAGQRAKRICRSECPVREACLDYALRHNEPKGTIWGGLSKPERDKIRAARRRAEKASTAA